MGVHNFRELHVWKKAIELAKYIYHVTATFPENEKFGMVAQLRRASVSIPSNIAEGCGRNGQNELKHFLSIALGSAYELETQMILSREFDFITEEKKEQIIQNIQEVQKMIIGLHKSIH